MAASVLDELDTYFTGEIEQSVGPGGDDQAADGDADEDQPGAAKPAATAEAEERRYQERFNRDVAALRSTYDKKLALAEDALSDLNVDIAERDEFIEALNTRYEQYDGDDASKLRTMREQRKAMLKEQAKDKRKLARLEAATQAVDLATKRQDWLADNVRRGAFPQTILAHPDIQRAIAAGESDRDVMATINGLLAAELRKSQGASTKQADPRPASKVEQTREREQARGKQPLVTAGGGVPPTPARTFAEAAIALERGLSKIKIA